jgi:hypothetical protein
VSERFVILGLGQARSSWFTDLARMANSGAVLVMALLGALMWVAFKALFADASARTSTQVGQIGS